MRNLVAVIAAAVGSVLFGLTLAEAAECPGNPGALGTSRTLVVDPTEHPRLGSMQYHETLPLEDHEIVITFDDGPLPPRSTRVLEILDHECVKATFFLIGKMAHTFPDGVRRIRDAGHTIGTHSYSHPLTFHRMSLDKAEFEINQGIALVTSALGDGSGPAPFFHNAERVGLAWPIAIAGAECARFRLPGDSAKLSDATKASTDTVMESRDAVAVDEIQRLLESLPEAVMPSANNHDQKIQPSLAADASTRTVPPQPLHGPIANAAMPRGSFP